MQMVGILVPISLFAMIAVIVIVPRYYKSLERQKMADTVRAAIERGQPLPPEMIEAMTIETRPRPSPQRDLRMGLVWIGLAVGLVAMGVALGFGGEPDATYPLIGVACLPGFIGAAFVVMYLLGKSRK
jgi:hypothetical protein